MNDPFGYFLKTRLKKFSKANMSLSSTSSFIGEFLMLVGAFQRNSLVVKLAALEMILSAAYSLWLYNRVIFENFKPKFLQKISNQNRREAHVKDLRRRFGARWALLSSSSWVSIVCLL